MFYLRCYPAKVTIIDKMGIMGVGSSDMYFGQGKELSRIGGGGSGGAATKGSGETKLETDRRRIRRSIYELSERIEILKKERDLRRERRKKSGIKTVAIVGYTNAGKSTLMNLLTKAGVKAEDKLFATLD